jgi:hypothetical protein
MEMREASQEYFDDFAAILDFTYGHWKTAVVKAVTSLRLLDELDRLSLEKGASPVLSDEVFYSFSMLMLVAKWQSRLQRVVEQIQNLHTEC